MRTCALLIAILTTGALLPRPGAGATGEWAFTLTDPDRPGRSVPVMAIGPAAATEPCPVLADRLHLTAARIPSQDGHRRAGARRLDAGAHGDIFTGMNAFRQQPSGLDAAQSPGCGDGGDAQAQQGGDAQIQGGRLV